jgi:hypothetical protein
VLAALFTPLADPARIAVADQLHRLRTGAVALADFDFEFLRFDSARYGPEALARLRDDRSTADAEKIADRVAGILAAATRNQVDALRPLRLVAQPPGTELPAGFVEQIAGESLIDETCRVVSCRAAELDVDDDGEPEVAVYEAGRIHIYGRDGARWRLFAYATPVCAEADLEEVWTEVRTAPSSVSDVLINGRRYQVQVSSTFRRGGSCRGSP